MAAPAPEPAPAVPTFVNGLAQNVFSARPADWISGEVWVESSFDTDGDGKLDRMHADYTLPKETATDGLKVPVIYEDSPYYAGTGADYATGPSTTSSAPRRPRARSRPFFNGTQHEPDDQHDLRVDLAAARLRRRALRVARHRATPTAARPPAAPTRRSARPPSSTGSTAARKAYTTRTGTVEAPPVTGTTARRR